jgi:hypothetical protein
MHVSFLTPAGALVGLVGVLALAMLFASERRSRAACVTLGLEPRRPVSVLGDALAIAAVSALLGAATAQPVISTTQAGRGRGDAQAIVVVDTTRSMEARSGQRGQSRFDRSRALAIDLRAAFPELPVGIASVTDRTLPHLFPSLSANAFAATLDRAVGIERPPPDRRGGRATSLVSLGDLARHNFFSRKARRRVAIVFTDGESLPVDLGTIETRLRAGRVNLVFVHVWRQDESIFKPDGTVDSGYRPDTASRVELDRVASAVDGATFSETEFSSVVAAVEDTVGDGPVTAQGRELRASPLAPYAVAAAFVPLLVILRRRNL